MTAVEAICKLYLTVGRPDAPQLTSQDEREAALSPTTRGSGPRFAMGSSLSTRAEGLTLEDALPSIGAFVVRALSCRELTSSLPPQTRRCLCPWS